MLRRLASSCRAPFEKGVADRRRSSKSRARSPPGAERESSTFRTRCGAASIATPSSARQNLSLSNFTPERPWSTVLVAGLRQGRVHLPCEHFQRASKKVGAVGKGDDPSVLGKQTAVGAYPAIGRHRRRTHEQECGSNKEEDAPEEEESRRHGSTAKPRGNHNFCAIPATIVTDLSSVNTKLMAMTVPVLGPPGDSTFITGTGQNELSIIVIVFRAGRIQFKLFSGWDRPHNGCPAVRPGSRAHVCERFWFRTVQSDAFSCHSDSHHSRKVKGLGEGGEGRGGVKGNNPARAGNWRCTASPLTFSKVNNISLINYLCSAGSVQ